MDLDAMLDDAAEEHLPVFDLDAELKSSGKLNGIKPWLAFSCNVPVAKRDEWSRMVKVDSLLSAAAKTRPSNTYFSWEKSTSVPIHGGDKLLQEVLRGAASSAGCDETLTAQIVGMANPVVDLDGARNLQKQYRKQLLKDVTPIVKKDPNFNKERFPNLGAVVGDDK